MSKPLICQCDPVIILVMLEAVELSKVYKTPAAEIVIFKGLNLTIAKSDLVAIMGPSGAGKSTLLHLLGGLDTPTAGKVLFQGKDVFELSSASLAEFRNFHVGFVFQFHHLLPEFTAIENTAMPLLLRGISRGEALDRAGQLIERVGLRTRSEHRVGELSGGEQQRVAIARALVGDPEILLADEPTGNLDLHTGEEILDFVHQLHNERGLTSVIVTHNEKIATQCQQVWKIEAGHLEKV